MKKSDVVGLIAAPLMAFALSLPVWADSTPTTCKDGTTSTSTGKGTCSGHGGVQKAGTTAAPAAPAASTPAAAPAAPAASGGGGGTSTCKDGTTSTSTGKGTCSGHGGVQKDSKSQPAAAATAATPAAPAAAATAPAAAKSSTASKSAPTAASSNTDPTGATAKCKDGTYSKSQHRSGTCSSHGGVAQWLTAE
jgi:Protein of unknown function (DUF3761)